MTKSANKDDELEALREAHENALKQIAALQASVNSAANDRKEGVEMIRTQKNRIEALEQAKANVEKQLGQMSHARGPIERKG